MAHRPGAVAVAAGHHLRQPRRRAVASRCLHGYTTEAMADDAVAVLDAARRRARARLRLLARRDGRPAAGAAPSASASARSCSGATHAGGPRAVRARPTRSWPSSAGADDAAPRRRRGRPSRSTTARACRARARRTASPRTSGAGSSIPFTEQAYRAQLFAAALHNCQRRLKRIEAPTLVVHGAHDRMIPVANAEILAERIPGAKLRDPRGRPAPLPDRASPRSTTTIARVPGEL